MSALRGWNIDLKRFDQHHCVSNFGANQISGFRAYILLSQRPYMTIPSKLSRSLIIPPLLDMEQNRAPGLERRSFLSYFLTVVMKVLS